MPSGAWADLVDRRNLLAASGPIQAAGFAVWLLWPGYAGFATGFVLWALSGALTSGTFEAYVYDELAREGRQSAYVRLLAAANAAGVSAAAIGMVTGAPLYLWGGYGLVGTVSVAVGLLRGALARTLPAAPRVETADETLDVLDRTARSTVLRRYVAMLRDGVAEATRRGPLRRLVLIAAVLMGLSAYDEFFPLLAREQGAATADVPLLMALITSGEVAGSALAGRAKALSRRALAGIVSVAAAALAAGALAGHPLGLAGIAVGYGAVRCVTLTSEAAVQAAISGRARATVTSTVGFGAEVVAVACYATVAVGSPWLSVAPLLALLCVPLLAVARAIARS